LIVGRNEAAIDSIAVLPFINAGADPNTEYLSDGLADTINYSLSARSELRFRSRSPRPVLAR
jgi:TolB-like protein